jgi:predicted negative regulator of RcsB-dependent stress response
MMSIGVRAYLTTAGQAIKARPRVSLLVVLSVMLMAYYVVLGFRYWQTSNCIAAPGA